MRDLGYDIRNPRFDSTCLWILNLKLSIAVFLERLRRNYFDYFARFAYFQRRHHRFRGLNASTALSAHGKRLCVAQRYNLKNRWMKLIEDFVPKYRLRTFIFQMSLFLSPSLFLLPSVSAVILPGVNHISTCWYLKEINYYIIWISTGPVNSLCVHRMRNRLLFYSSPY